MGLIRLYMLITSIGPVAQNAKKVFKVTTYWLSLKREPIPLEHAYMTDSPR